MSSSSSSSASSSSSSSSISPSSIADTLREFESKVPLSSGFNAKSTAQDVLNKYPDSVKGLNALVTGGTSGIGIETVRVLAKGGANVYFTARDLKKGEAVLKSLKSDLGDGLGKNIHIIELDLASLASVRKAADSFLSLNIPLNILILNGGVLGHTLRRTVDGFEETMGVNHFAHFLLTNLLAPLLASSSSEDRPSRVVSVSSAVILVVPSSLNFDDINVQKSESIEQFSGIVAYAKSKLANVLFTLELAKLYKSKGINSYSLHPGVIETSMPKKYTAETGMVFEFNKTLEQGASTSIYAAISPDLNKKTGIFLYDNNDAHEAVLPHLPTDYEDQALKLWQISQELTKSPPLLN